MGHLHTFAISTSDLRISEPSTISATNQWWINIRKWTCEPEVALGDAGAGLPVTWEALYVWLRQKLNGTESRRTPKVARVIRDSGFFRGLFSRSCWRCLGMEEITNTVSVLCSMLMSAGVCVYTIACVRVLIYIEHNDNVSWWVYVDVNILTYTFWYILMHVGVCSHAFLFFQLTGAHWTSPCAQ